MEKLETDGIEKLAEEKPDILALICEDNFLPPRQLLLALKSFDAGRWITRPELIIERVEEFYSYSLLKKVKELLGIEPPPAEAA